MEEVVVAAPSVFAAEVGAGVGREGGSVVDALVAATITAMCSEPGVCAPGGGGYLTVGNPGEEPISIDGSMAMPGMNLDPRRTIEQRTVSMEYGGGVTTDVGPGSIAVPGGFAALDGAHKRWGRMDWNELLGYVADAFVDGFPLPRSCHYYLEFSGEPVFSADPASRAALYDGDRLRGTGETVVVAGLVDSLRQIGEQGAQTFYRGDLAASMVADLAERGSRVTREDLAEYQVIVTPALVSGFDSWTVATTPPPAVGGVTLSAILRLIHRSGDPLDPTVWVGAQREVFAIRAERLETSADREQEGWAVLSEIPDGASSSGSTVNISAAGSDGSVAAATMSGGYGSGVIPQGTGLWMNNSLGEAELNPGGLEANAVGGRLMSNMAPTVALERNRRIAIGSPGADRITSALATTLTLILNGAGLAESVEHPRAHVEFRQGCVAVEPGLELTQNHPLRTFEGLDMFFGGVTAVEVLDREVRGHADSRRTGGVASSLVPQNVETEIRNQ